MFYCNLLRFGVEKILDAITLLELVSIILVNFRSAELGFLGARIYTLVHVPFLTGFYKLYRPLGDQVLECEQLQTQSTARSPARHRPSATVPVQVVTLLLWELLLLGSPGRSQPVHIPAEASTACFPSSTPGVQHEASLINRPRSCNEPGVQAWCGPP